MESVSSSSLHFPLERYTDFQPLKHDYMREAAHKVLEQAWLDLVDVFEKIQPDDWEREKGEMKRIRGAIFFR